MKTLLIASIVLFAPFVAAEDEPTTNVHLLVTVIDEEDSSWDVEDRQTGTPASADLGTLWLFGLAAQQTWGDVLQWGYEGGVLGTRKEDDTHFRDSTETLEATIETRFTSVSGFLGGVVGVQPLSMLRLYASAGPAVTWAYVDQDDDDDDDLGVPTLDIDLSEGNNDVTFAPYARAGLEIVFPNNFALGVSVHWTDGEFDFDEAGEVEYDDTMLVVTLGGRI